ncbi:hypothetical protein OHA37_27770 [Streptomyces sp. NBC_00335]|uniref:hypothetical protein n=1 Tax=unclassified Streptomyces TaxID=2593676 RepID=UPI002253A086|nr:MULTISPECIES: hypothetical protein [unclassified Streptomyces]MCX5407649.1 hypothetical protein [Streptomyces sp. NBC_00086]
MTRPTSRTRRPAVRWPRLLLFAALLLGIAGMHTLGHPTPAHAMEDVPSARFVPRGGHAPSGAGHGGRPVGAPDPAPADTADTVTPSDLAAARDLAAAAATTVEVATVEAPRPQHHGMDPMSVCLAVLGALTLLVLGAGLAGPRRAAPLGGAARAPGRSGGPDPPPPRELLTLLTVLRV